MSARRNVRLELLLFVSLAVGCGRCRYEQLVDGAGDAARPRDGTVAWDGFRPDTDVGPGTDGAPSDGAGPLGDGAPRDGTPPAGDGATSLDGRVLGDAAGGADGSVDGGAPCDLCTTGSTECVDGTSERSCDDWDRDGCTEWSPVRTCLSGQCTAGECTPTGTCPNPPATATAYLSGKGQATCDPSFMIDGTGRNGYLATTAPLSAGTVDGIQVGACALVDLGALCRPSSIGITLRGESGGCGAPCTAGCTLCDSVHMFASEGSDQPGDFYSIGVVNVTTMFIGTGRSVHTDVRYIMVCRPAGCDETTTTTAISGVYPR